MLTVICLILGVIICSIITVYCFNNSGYSDWPDIVGIISAIFGTISLILLITSIISIIVVHANPEGQLAAYQAEKAMLEYRLSQKEYLNDNNIGMTELMKDITKYNSDIVEAQHGLQSPWVNWFYADYMNELTPIILDNSD